MKTLLVFALSAWLLVPFAGFQEPAEPGFDHAHASWSKVLREFVVSDRVDYLALSQKRGELDRYLLSLTSRSGEEFAQWTKPQQCAFLVNAYNAFTLQAVLLNYPLVDVDSLRDVGGKESGKVWKERTIRLGQLLPSLSSELVSLEDVAGVLRTRFKDARVHAALCNSCLGSPALRSSAFAAESLERELDVAARAWLADGKRNRFDRKAKRIEASSLFDTYREDFVRDGVSVEAWIARYAPLEERAWIETTPNLERATLPFDWRLNDDDR